jgi:hypothetical protein
MADETEVHGDSKGVKANLWNSLEVLSTQAALLMEWEQELGDDFSAARVFLRPTQQQAGSYPCAYPISCGCRHRVVFDSPEDVSAVCDCDEGGCDPMLLRPSDLIVYALDGSMLAAAIRRAFGFDEIHSGGFEGLRSYLVGGWGIRRSHVFFNVPISENGLLKEIDRLCAAVPDPFVLLTPTSRFCTPMVQRALRRQGCAQMALGGVLKLITPGVLELVPDAKGAVDVFFGGFGRHVAQGKPLELAIGRVEAKLDAIARSRMGQQTEAVSEDAARQALEIVRKLDAGDRIKKPSLLTVFRHYCVNGMSAGQIAIRLGCSKAVVMKRLKVLAEKTGIPAAQLRTYSAQFEQIEEGLSDSRARRIDRWKLAHDEKDDEENQMD